MQHADLAPFCHCVAADDAGSVTAGERQLAGIGLGIVDELVDRMDWQCWIDHKNQSETSHAGDRHKVLDRIVAQAPVYEWVGGQRRAGPHAERIAVRRLMMDVESSQRSVRSRAIFDEDRLAEYWAELVGDDAANRVAPAARTKHVNDGDRPRRIIVGIKRRTEQCRCGGY